VIIHQPDPLCGWALAYETRHAAPVVCVRQGASIASRSKIREIAKKHDIRSERADGEGVHATVEIEDEIPGGKNTTMRSLMALIGYRDGYHSAGFPARRAVSPMRDFEARGGLPVVCVVIAKTAEIREPAWVRCGSLLRSKQGKASENKAGNSSP